MLVAAKIICENLSKRLSELANVRSDWTKEFVSDLLTRIDNAVKNFLGLDPKQSLRSASKTVYEIQVPALRDLSLFKVQIDGDYLHDKAQRDEILTTLGFAELFKKAMKKEHEAIIQLLYTFTTNMTPALKTEITSNGMQPSLIDRISGYADTLQAANVTQGTAKLSTKVITESAIIEFNAIYDDISVVCKIASKYYKADKLLKDMFTFSKIIRNMGTHKNNQVEIGSAETPPVLEK
jgi:hypothetical protein